MFQKYFLLTCVVFFISCSAGLFAQKDQIPLEPQLEQSSERQLIKIGMISESKPAKLKFGSFNTDNRKGHRTISGNDGSELLFSFEIQNSNGNVAKVEASGNKEGEKNTKDSGQQNDVSVYISTSLEEDDLWVLLVGKNNENKDLSLNNIFLTNGNEEITFKHVIGAPTNKSEVTAPKGIEAFVDGYPIAAMQYYSGGSFSYKKFIWISNKTEAQMQLVMAAVFSAMLEIGDYFEDNGFVE
ncbi:MAG: hypothetical protein GY908_01890 [Flavobacteriales bacterium]|nr:hypothetical protein [Flavobacteriales bacterium]